MQKIKLEIVGLSYSQTQAGAYALVLAEVAGNRSLPIIIGAFEAQAIAIELEKMAPSRPLTHDLFKIFADSFSIQVKEVLIYNLAEGIFYAKMICVQGEDVVEIDARTSDAIAIGIKSKAPIYTYESILDSAGIEMDENAPEDFEEDPEIDFGSEKHDEEEDDSNTLSSNTLDQLQDMLQSAIEIEDYELASRIRDEISKRK